MLRAQVLAYGFGAVAGLFHGLFQLFPGNAQRLGPVLDLVLLVQVDAGAVLLAAVLQIVGHDGSFSEQMDKDYMLRMPAAATGFRSLLHLE
jgi:hypothetical protein